MWSVGHCDQRALVRILKYLWLQAHPHELAFQHGPQSRINWIAQLSYLVCLGGKKNLLFKNVAFGGYFWFFIISHVICIGKDSYFSMYITGRNVTSSFKKKKKNPAWIWIEVKERGAKVLDNHHFRWMSSIRRRAARWDWALTSIESWHYTKYFRNIIWSSLINSTRDAIFYSWINCSSQK